MSLQIIRKARRSDLHRIVGLLESESLPLEGVLDHLQNFMVAEVDGTVVGSIGLEVYDETALLRSAVVDTSHRNTGIGTRLFDTLIGYARELGVNRLLLLTNTAEGYFLRKGFVRIERGSVVGPVTTSTEFAGACPSNAVCMELILRCES